MWWSALLFLLLKGELDDGASVKVHDVDEGQVSDAARVDEKVLERPHLVVVVLHQASQHRHQKVLQVPAKRSSSGQRGLVVKQWSRLPTWTAGTCLAIALSTRSGGRADFGHQRWLRSACPW